VSRELENRDIDVTKSRPTMKRDSLNKKEPGMTPAKKRKGAMVRIRFYPDEQLLRRIKAAAEKQSQRAGLCASFG
jgi:hypothetical protein